jgi:hypothetical protein
MKRIHKILVLLIVFSLMMGSFPLNALAEESISINQTKNLMVGDSKMLVLSGAEPDEVIWTSGNESVATVNAKGIVTGVGTGSVTITAALKDDASVTASVTLLVRSSYPYDVEWSGTYTSANNNTTTTTVLPTDPNRIQQAWTAQVGNNTIVIVDDYIYTYDGVSGTTDTSAGGTLYKLNKETGEVVSTLSLSAGTTYYYSYMIYGGGLLYISCPDSVMAIDPDSFTLLWTAAVPMKMYCTLQFVNNCVVTNGTVLNSTTGEKIATLSCQSSLDWSSGAEVGNRFYIAAGNKVYAYDTATWAEVDVLTFEGSGAGLMHNAGWLYWADKSAGKLHAMQLDNGNFNDSTYVGVDCGYSTLGAPVAAGGRVYLAGYKKDGSQEGTGYGAVCVFTAGKPSLVYTAQMSGTGHKVQGTPIVSVASSGGNVVSGMHAPKAGDGSVYVYVQDYAVPGSIYMLADNSTQSSASLTKLIMPDPGQYAWEQIACDKDGALYVTNDAGFLQKYQTAKVAAPVITADLSTAEVTYGQNGTCDSLTVMAMSTDGGKISYQWQSRTENGVFTNIPGATENSFTPSTKDAGTTYYRCVVTNTLSGEKVTTNSKVAKITVLERKVANGDTNGDGTVDAKDVTVLRRYLAGWSVDIQLDAADLNGDGEVNAKDVTVLRRQLAS